MSLRKKVSHGIFWEGGAMLAGRTLGFAVTILLARLLAPEDFGLLAIATLAINSMVFLQELGFGAALIYREEDVDTAATTAHWTIIASSLVLYGIVFLAAPLVALFFRSPEVTPVLRVLALTIVISSVSRVPLVLLSKELDFRRKVMPEFAAGVGGNFMALILALLGWGVWALVWGQVFGMALSAVLAYRVSSWRPKWGFHRKVFLELFGYGKHIAASQVLIFGITNIDDLFVGRMLGQETLGQYNLAYKVSNLPATNITRLVTRVTFPAFTKLRGDVARMRNAFFRLVRYVSLLAFPVAIATILFAHDFVHIVLTDKWAPAIVPIQILAIYGLIRSVAANMGTIFQAGGKPQWLTGIAAWRLVTMAVLLYPAIRLGGLVGVCWLSTGVAIVDFFISANLVNRIIDGRMITYLRLTAPIAVYALIAGGLGLAIEKWLLSTGLWDVLALAAGGLTIVLIYGALTWWRDREVRQEGQKLVARLRQADALNAT
ncbi:MAG: lipopolysaccharide biosynthesis protein [Chloroflexota bacterium]|nr:lipopolysaccharide biosynthesis protein [Chloroflexota bacterium]